jgi:hypothetical protein
VRLLVRTALGLALFTGGLTFLAYGIAQAVENGSCGTDEYGRVVGPACPSGFGAMIVLMIVGAFVALGGSALFASRRRGLPGLALIAGMARFFAAAFVTAGAAVVLGLVDVHADDTRPGLEIVALVTGAVLVTALPGSVRGSPPSGSPRVAAAAASPPAAIAPSPPAPGLGQATARAEDIASRLRQLEQLRDSGLLDGDELAERRKQILEDL